MSANKTSPSWKRPLSERLKASFGTNPLPPPQTLPSQLPSADQPIRLNLEDTTLIYDNGRWISGMPRELIYYYYYNIIITISVLLCNHNRVH